MSSQVIRISSGEVIQVRTGVVQGIGPQGPIGPTGSVGPAGPQGPQGVPGPMGAVSQFATEVQATAQSIATATVTSNELATYTNVAFATVTRDDLSAAQSSTNFVFSPDVSGADYRGEVYIKYSKQASVNASGSRSVRVMYGGFQLAGVTLPASVLMNTEITLPFSFHSTSISTVLNVVTAHNEGVTLSVTGRMWLNRTGPGPTGPQGPAGIQGSPGPVGAQGPIGPAGSIATNTTTFASIGGDDL